MLESIFINGLHEEIQAELRLHESRNLSELMDRALLIEEKNIAASKSKGVAKDKTEWGNKGGGWRTKGGSLGSKAGQYKTYAPRPNVNISGPSETKVQTGGGEEKRASPGKKLSQEELRELSRKGLCFKCGGKWGPDHVCKLKHFKLVLLEDEEEGGETEELGPEAKELEMEAKILQLSLRSKEGLTSNRSFKVKGEVNQRLVLILIDSGASSNFISHKLAQELQLEVEETPRYMVEIGTGERVSNQGVCKGVKVQVQDKEIIQNFFMMELGGTEMVLGMDWLASLGNIEANFKQLVIKWNEGGQKVSIRGDPSLCKDQASWKAMIKAIQDEGEAFMLQFHQMLDTIQASSEVAPEISAILDSYDDVF